jgi:threonine/homoserine/homoserine lactone efflux protein
MSFIAFLIAAAVLAITPGPGIARVVARQLALRRVSGVTLVFFGVMPAMARSDA